MAFRLLSPRVFRSEGGNSSNVAELTLSSQSVPACTRSTITEKSSVFVWMLATSNCLFGFEDFYLMDGTALAQSVFHLVCGISLHTGINILGIVTIVSISIPTTNIMSVVVFAILIVIKNTYIYH